MAVLRYIAPALAVAGYAAAASCSAATTTIQNSGDATALADCRTFTGSIAIATGVNSNIALDGIEEITGSLIADGAADLPSLSGANLMTIGEDFTLNGLTALTNLAFPMLSAAKTVSWITLTELQGLSFGSPGLQQVDSLTISDTQLNTLDGIDLVTATDIDINNNGYLKSIEMQVGNVSDSLQINFNGQMVEVSFPNLIWVANMTIRDASTVSIPSLAAVNGSLGFYSNLFESLSAPNLTSVGGTLAIDENNALSNASFPLLKTLNGGLQIQNNTKLDQISGFPALQHVVGAVDIYGNFSNVTLPSLNYVQGDFNLQSSQDLSQTCPHFQGLTGSGNPIHGIFTCEGNLGHPNTTNTLPPGTSSGNGDGSTGTGTGSSNSASTSSSAAHPLLIPGATGLLGVIAAVFGML